MPTCNQGCLLTAKREEDEVITALLKYFKAVVANDIIFTALNPGQVLWMYYLNNLLPIGY